MLSTWGCVLEQRVLHARFYSWHAHKPHPNGSNSFKRQALILGGLSTEWFVTGMGRGSFAALCCAVLHMLRLTALAGRGRSLLAAVWRRGWLQHRRASPVGVPQRSA